ncbi:uncharacterized protein LOC110466377 [Mizuhopecten yessoensis]|uniref:Uncharacterized protein n=1 Tax=Mizuhopecten yessoensis TaxID=6573 RepID=A0A210PPE9_MIZYE|nr:uncharacterized protein LOC110466377 [Mizuhopecten yessoensis]OWF38375.1 hypothetical protein KP79_PYT10748 [Mizuhopecten yessoensis]
MGNKPCKPSVKEDHFSFDVANTEEDAEVTRPTVSPMIGMCSDLPIPLIIQEDADRDVISGSPQPPKDSYDKLMHWLVEMADGDDIDLKDPKIAEEFCKSPLIGNAKNRKKNLGPRSQSYDIHVSYEGPLCSKPSRSCGDIEEETEAEGYMENQPKPKSFKLSPDPPSHNRNRSTLKKQSAVSFDSTCGDPTQYKRSSKSYSDLNDSANFFVNQQQSLLRSHHKVRQVPKTQRNQFTKQYSEPVSSIPKVCVYESIDDSGSNCSDRNRNQSSSASLDSRSPRCSRQTTFSDEDDLTYEKSKSSLLHPPLEIMTVREHEEEEAEGEGGVIRSNRRKHKGKISGMISRSVENLLGKTSRLRHRLKYRSSSLFTVNNDDKSEIPPELFNDKLFLNDKLLDGNIDDILYAVDTLWPNE